MTYEEAEPTIVDALQHTSFEDVPKECFQGVKDYLRDLVEEGHFETNQDIYNHVKFMTSDEGRFILNRVKNEILNPTAHK